MGSRSQRRTVRPLPFSLGSLLADFLLLTATSSSSAPSSISTSTLSSTHSSPPPPHRPSPPLQRPTPPPHPPPPNSPSQRVSPALPTTRKTVSLVLLNGVKRGRCPRSLGRATSRRVRVVVVVGVGTAEQRGAISRCLFYRGMLDLSSEEGRSGRPIRSPPTLIPRGRTNLALPRGAGFPPSRFDRDIRLRWPS